MNEMRRQQVDSPVTDMHQDQTVMHRTGLSLVSQHCSTAIQVSKREAPSVCRMPGLALVAIGNRHLPSANFVVVLSE